MRIDEDKKDGAIVTALQADVPGLCHPHCVILDRGVALHLREDGDNDLV